MLCSPFQTRGFNRHLERTHMTANNPTPIATLFAEFSQLEHAHFDTDAKARSDTSHVNYRARDLLAIDLKRMAGAAT